MYMYTPEQAVGEGVQPTEQLGSALFDLRNCGASEQNRVARLLTVVGSVGRETQQQLHHPLDHVRVQSGHLNRKHG